MKKSILLPLFFVMAYSLAAGQTQGGAVKFERAESLRREYRFVDAIKLFKEIREESTDSVYIRSLDLLIAKSENGIQMLQYASRPLVTAKITAPRKDFFLYIPGLEKSYWANLPDSLNSNIQKHTSPNPVLLRRNDRTIYFSAQDQDGGWDIYRIQQVDGANWSAPEPLNSYVNSSGDELYPVLSPNGKQLYFASSGHFGIGGFDIYVSNWDDKANDWGLPQNLGFPYSSVDDDLMLIHSEDGEFTYLVTDRNTNNKDSVVIYRFEYENTPVRRAITEISEIIKTASLAIPSKEAKDSIETELDFVTTPETEAYTKMIAQVRQLQRDIDSVNRSIANNRSLYNSLTNEDDRVLLEKRIFEGELALIDTQSRLRVANEMLQVREMEFLSKGAIMPRRDDFFSDKQNEPETPAEKPFTPVRGEFAQFPQITIMEPIKLFDYAFAVGSEAVMAEDNSIPDRLVYRVQLFVVNNKPDLKAFKGLRPVFENRTPTGKWLYTAGQFFNYAAAAEALVKVKRAGFPTAIIVAYNDGKSITIRNARLLEEKNEARSSFQVKIEGYPAGMPQPVLDIIRENTERDIAKKVLDGREIFFIGPFANRQQAEQMVTLLSGVGAERLTIEEINSTPE
ncbi:MAG: hypothetical protein Q8S23_07845 [Bacteroidales bacterium]|nr:hypothetical protein [Bacteroidales bacterium]